MQFFALCEILEITDINKTFQMGNKENLFSRLFLFGAVSSKKRYLPTALFCHFFNLSILSHKHLIHSHHHWHGHN